MIFNKKTARKCPPLQVNQAPAYGKMSITENGVSGMDFDMEINMKEYKGKRLTKTSNVGKWNSAMKGAIDYKTGLSTKMQLAATNVYKVAVVVVSERKTYVRITNIDYCHSISASTVHHEKRQFTGQV